MSESAIAVSGGARKLGEALDARRVTVLETVRAGGSGPGVGRPGFQEMLEEGRER